MGTRYEDSSPMENLIEAVTRIADALEPLYTLYGCTKEDMRAATANHAFLGQLEAQHNDRAATGGPGNNDYAGAQIIYGCYCRTCSYWRSKLA